MSVSKPAIADSRFGVDGSNVDASNLVAPTSGLRDTAYPTNAIPTTGNWNYLKNRDYRWFQFIDEVFKVAGTAVADLKLSGQATFGGALVVGGQALTFTNFTYTANSGTDALTATAHPLQTGDGPVQTSNSGGALPGGLAAATNYFAIFVDANTFKLATSFANSIAGVAIDITTNGTGTQTLLVQGGTTRATDATVSRNAIVGGTVTAIEYKHGLNTLLISGCDFAAAAALSPVWDQQGLSATSMLATATIPLRAGMRILAVRTYIIDSATGPTKLTAALAKTSTTATIVGISGTGASSGAGTAQTLSMTGLSVIVTTGFAYTLQVATSTGTASTRVIMAEVDYDVP